MKWPAAPNRRQMAAPMPPLPPVTKARVAALFMGSAFIGSNIPVQTIVGVEYHGCAAAHEPACRRPQLEFIERAGSIARDARGVADQIGLDVVEPQHMQPNRPDAGEQADLRPAAGFGAGRGCGPVCDVARGA